MLEQPKIVKHKRINLYMPNCGKLKVLSPEEISQYSTSAPAGSKQTLLDHEMGPFPLQYHQGASENCMNNRNHHPAFLESTIQANATNILSQQNVSHIQNTIKTENMSSAIHELANLHKTSKYQAFKKRVLNNQTIQKTHLGVFATKSVDMDVGSADIIRINSDSEDESDTGKSLELNQRSPTDRAERRRRNNDAARRSRMKKKMLQNEVAMRAAFLAQENYELRRDLDVLKYQMTILREQLRNRLKI